VYVAGAISVGSWGGGAFLSVMTFIVAREERMMSYL
jgi:hypothetical protein